MKRLFKLILVIIVIILIGSAAYAVVNIDINENGKDGDKSGIKGKQRGQEPGSPCLRHNRTDVGLQNENL